VLSAVEGLKMVDPALSPYVLPLSVIILIALFCMQALGTARIGKLFGPVMLIWFATIAVMGVYGIAHYPAVIKAANPLHGLSYLYSHGRTGFLVLGGVFLCVTGAEALYADMGHYGAKPIRLAWSAVVFPSLLLNYAGQAALVLSGDPASENIFYRLCPQSLLIPMVILATAATIIASQSIITGAFSMTRQAIQLGWLPRLHIAQTSQHEYGQIYVRAVNWILMLVTCGLALAFGKSGNLASAYGIAVSTTMLATSLLLYVAMREIWQWSRAKAGIIAGIFIVIDTGFVASNISKIAAGGYIPLLLAAMVYTAMLVWHKGAKAVARNLQGNLVPIGQFLAHVAEANIPRVPGTAVFLTRTKKDAPPVMLWHVKHSRALHTCLFALTVTAAPSPRIDDGKRLTIEEIAPNFWRATAQYGFMERPDIPSLLQQVHTHGCGIDLSDITYYVGHESIIRRDHDKGLPRWVVSLFSLMQRNAVHVCDYLRLPPDNMVEIGRQIAI
jgi:KUP system potassium uptake protein